MLFKKMKQNKRGMSPGSLVFTGEKKVDEIKISVFDFNARKVDEINIAEKELSKLKKYKTSKNVTWINICGIHNTQVIDETGKIFGIHPLVLEDILNVSHSPKSDDYDDYVFIVTKMINYNNELNELNIEQVSFVVGKNFLITFQEREGDVFDLIREKIRSNSGRIRKSGSDYLAYRLIDTMVDNYFTVLEKVDEHIEKIEDSLLVNPEDGILQNIHSIRKEIIRLKRAVSPLRDIIYNLEREQYSFIAKSTYVYLRDLYDHIKQIADNVENYREVINGLQEVYISQSGQKMNEIVKILTIISTIFIPLTFIVGIYGMNFHVENSPWNMPELTWRYGYPFVIFVMICVVIGMLIFFKRKKWL